MGSMRYREAGDCGSWFYPILVPSNSLIFRSYYRALPRTRFRTAQKCHAETLRISWYTCLAGLVHVVGSVAVETAAKAGFPHLLVAGHRHLFRHNPHRLFQRSFLDDPEEREHQKTRRGKHRRPVGPPTRKRSIQNEKQSWQRNPSTYCSLQQTSPGLMLFDA